MNPILEGYEIVPREAFRRDLPLLTIGRRMRLSKKAFEALGNPRYVLLEFDRFQRLLSIRSYMLEEGQLLPLGNAGGDATHVYGSISKSRCILGASEFHDMLLRHLKGDFIFKLPGEMNGEALEFRLDHATAFQKPA